MRTAVASRFNPELAGFLTGQSRPHDVARELVAEHLFTMRIDSDDEWFRYHHLFQAFLNERFRSAEPGQWAETHRQAARWWADSGERVEVVRHLIACGDHVAAAEYLAPVVAELIAGPEAELVSEWLGVIGEEVWGRYPALVVARATLLLNEARHEEAFAEFDRAIASLAEAGDVEGAAGLTVRLQQAMLAAGTQPQRRILLGETAIGRLDESARMLPVARIMLATAYGYGCRFDDARAQLEQAASHSAFDDAQRLMADVGRAFYVDFWESRPTDALAVISTSRLALAEGATADPFGLHAVTAMLECYTLLELGYYDDVAAVRDAVFRVWEESGMGREAVRRADGWVRATLYAGQADWDALEEWLTAPPRVSADAPVTSYAYRYRVPAALLWAARDRAPEAEKQIRACTAEMERFGATFDRPVFLCDLARAAHLIGRDDLAGDLSCAALGDAQRFGGPWARARAQIWVATTKSEARRGALADALALTDRYALHPLWTHRERENAGPLLRWAEAEGVGPEELIVRLREGLASQHDDESGGHASVRPWSDGEVDRAIERMREGALDADSRTLAEQTALVEMDLETAAAAGHPDPAARGVRFLRAAATELERRGELVEAIACVRRLVELRDAPEAWHRELMDLLARSGRTDLAMRQYHVLAARLHRFDGGAPARDTEDLYSTLLLSRDATGEPEADGEISVVFTDIVGSTVIAGRVGDRRWASIIADHEDLLQVYAVEFGGRVVKTQGDGGMFAFPKVDGALGFAGSVQRSVSAASQEDAPLRIRIGVNTGEAVRLGGDYLGRTVILAARLMDLADGGEVLISTHSHAAMDQSVFKAGSPRRAVLKGIAEAQEVWSLDW